MSMYLIINFLLMFLNWGNLKYKYLAINYLIFVLTDIFNKYVTIFGAFVFNVKTVI